MYKNKFLRSTAVIASIGLIVGCGSSNSNDPVATGYFGKLVDTAVAGAGWSCGTVSGITGADGGFGLCPLGSEVTFTIGDVVLGSVTATADFIFTPQDLAGVPRTETDDPAGSTIAALLLSLDTDGDPTNGISITAADAAAFTAASPTTTPDYSTTTDAEIAALITATNPALTPVSTADAEAHLVNTLGDIGTGVIAPPVQPTDESTN